MTQPQKNGERKDEPTGFSDEFGEDDMIKILNFLDKLKKIIQ